MELRAEDLKAMSEVNKLFNELTIDGTTIKDKIKDNKYGFDFDSLINDHNAGVAGFISSVNVSVLIALLIEKDVITGEEYATSVKTLMSDDNTSLIAIKQSRDMILSLLDDDDSNDGLFDDIFNDSFDEFKEV